MSKFMFTVYEKDCEWPTVGIIPSPHVSAYCFAEELIVQMGIEPDTLIEIVDQVTEKISCFRIDNNETLTEVRYSYE